MKKRRIISVDDREDDNYLLTHAIRKGDFSFDLKVLRDGQEAIEYFQKLDDDPDRNGAMPDLILLDLKMPRRNGFEVLDWIRNREAFKNSPVAVLTSSQNRNDIQRAYEKGAEWYLVKPVRFDALIQLVTVINESIATGNPGLIETSDCFCPPGEAQSQDNNASL